MTAALLPLLAETAASDVFARMVAFHHDPRAWRPGNNGCGKFVWFVHRRPTGCELIENSCSLRFVVTPTGKLRRFARRDAASRLAAELNREEGRQP